MNIQKYLLYFIAFFSGILLSSIIFLFVFVQNFSNNGSNAVRLMEDKSGIYIEDTEKMRQGAKQTNEMDHSMHSMNDMKSMPMMNDMLKIYTDKDFLELMILHHQDALDMANNALENSKNEFILKLSNDIIKTQSAEISQMEGELKNVDN